MQKLLKLDNSKTAKNFLMGKGSEWTSYEKNINR